MKAQQFLTPRILGSSWVLSHVSPAFKDMLKSRDLPWICLKDPTKRVSQDFWEIQRPPLLKKSSSKRQNHPKSKLLKFVLQIFLGHNTITIRIQRLESLRFDAFIATVQTKFLRVTQFPIGESWRNGTTIEARQLGLRKTE